MYRLNTKIRLTMLCFSGFELYSRWVPLNESQPWMEAPVPTVGSISSRCSGKERTLLSRPRVCWKSSLKRIEKSLHPNVLLSLICAKKRSKF